MPVLLRARRRDPDPGLEHYRIRTRPTPPVACSAGLCRARQRVRAGAGTGTRAVLFCVRSRQVTWPSCFARQHSPSCRLLRPWAAPRARPTALVLLSPPPARAQPRAHDSTACAHKATLACARDAHAHSTHLSEGRMAGRSRRQTAGWTGCGISAAWAAARRHTTKQIARGCPHAARLVQWKRRLGV